jgi:choline dehydrogenase-like flavoprotein
VGPRFAFASPHPNEEDEMPILDADKASGENPAQLKGAYDYVVVGVGASGSVVAGELSKTGAEVLAVESGGLGDLPTIINPSIWFYNVGGALDWNLPIAPVPQLNDRKFNMALGRVIGGGSSINAMVWSRGMERDYDTWERSGASDWGFKDVLPVFKSQEDWEGGADEWRGVGGPIHVRRPGHPHPTAPGVAELAAFFADDAVYHNIPLAPITGREAIANTIATFIRPGAPGIEGIDFGVINIAANGPVVMTERVDVFKVPNKSFQLQVMGTFEVSDGKINAWRDYFDLNQFTSRMG